MTSQTSITRQTKLTSAQIRVLFGLDQTAFYGSNQRTFGALLDQDLIRFRADHTAGPSGHFFELTEAGHALVNPTECE